MATHAAAHADHAPIEIPGRGRKLSIGMVGIGLFIGSEVMLFASFFVAYFMARFNIAENVWPPPPYHLPKLVTGINTLVLVSSSFTVWFAEHSIKHGDRKGLVRGLIATIMLGGTFLLIQMSEYATVGFNPASKAFGSTFYALTGLHGFHVIVGLTLLCFCLIRSVKGDFSSRWATPLNATSVYWHFVDVVWVILYILVYLI